MFQILVSRVIIILWKMVRGTRFSVSVYMLFFLLIISATKLRVVYDVIFTVFSCVLLTLTETLVVSLALICSFSRMRNYLKLGELRPEEVSEDILKAVAETLRKSSFLKVSEDGKKIGRTTEILKPEKVTDQVEVKTIAASPPLEYDVEFDDAEPFFSQFGKVDSQFDCSFSSLPVSDDMYDEASDPVLSPNAITANPTIRKSQRTKNFSREEDILLVSAWLNTSKDVFTGNESSSLWGRIYDYFVSNARTQVGRRSQTSVKNRWFVITSKCAKFVGYLSQIEIRQQGGQTEHERLVEARDLYASFVGKPFQYEHCLEKLKFEQKWLDTLSTKKQKIHSDASPASSSATTPQSAYLGDESEVPPELERQSCMNALKKQLKSKDNKDDAQDPITDQHGQEKVDFELAKAERHERELALRQRQLDLEEKRMELDVMQTDTTGMDPVSAKYWNSLKLEIMAKRGIDLQTVRTASQLSQKGGRSDS